MILKKCRIWSVILRKMPGPEYQRVKNQNAVVKNEGILDFQCVEDILSSRQKQMDFSNVPYTSGICPGCQKSRLLLLLLVKKECSSFVWNSQGAVVHAHQSERL